MVWLQFAACVLLILFAGSKAARYGDIIAEKTGLGRIWIGALLLAVVTSMPELVTSVSSIVLVQDPDLALGTLTGTCIYNLLILVILDVVFRPKSVLSFASSRHSRTVIIGTVLAVIVAGGIFLAGETTFLTIGWISIPSLLVFIVYLISVRLLSKKETNQPHPEVEKQYAHITIRSIMWKFGLVALIILGSGIWLSNVGEEIAWVTGWGSSFVGSLLLAITTSLPEITVAIAALRMGAIDLSLADILGANLLDLSYIFILDIFYRKGPILAHVSRSQIVLLGLLISMNLLILVGLKLKTKKKTFGVISWYVPFLVALYLSGTYFLFISQ